MMKEIYLTDNSILIWQLVMIINLAFVVYALTLIIKDHMKRKLNMVSFISLVLVVLIPLIGPLVYVWNYHKNFKNVEI